MPKKPKSNQADINTFLDAVKGVKILNHEKIPLNKHKVPLVVKKAYREQEEPPIPDLPYLSQHAYLPTLKSEQAVTYKLIGVANKTLRKLQKGQYNVEAVLDLHGMTVNNAQSAISEFLQDCLARSVHVGLIIHGKGLTDKAPVLKNKLNHWLREIPGIIAFCSAAPKHGGQGAMYIMFKRTATRGHFES